jgi:hypothetical protein
MSLDFAINPIPVLIAVVACTVLGGLYFTVIVAKPYAAMMGRAASQPGSRRPRPSPGSSPPPCRSF